VTFIKVLTMYLRLILLHPASSCCLTFPEKFQQVSLFHLHTWIPNTSTIFATLFLCLPLSLWYQSLDRTYFTFLSFIFLKMHFCLFMMVTGCFIVTFPYMYVLYPELFHPSVFLLFTLVILRWFQQVWVFHIHTCIEST
jgi:hypothetical protein